MGAAYIKAFFIFAAVIAGIILFVAIAGMLFCFFRKNKDEVIKDPLDFSLREVKEEVADVVKSYFFRMTEDILESNRVNINAIAFIHESREKVLFKDFFEDKEEFFQFWCTLNRMVNDQSIRDVIYDIRQLTARTLELGSSLPTDMYGWRKLWEEVEKNKREWKALSLELQEALSRN